MFSLIIIGTSSHEKFTKLSQINFSSIIAGNTRLASVKSYMVIIVPNSLEKATKREIKAS